MSDRTAFAESRVQKLSFFDVEHGHKAVAITAFNDNEVVARYVLSPEEARRLAADLNRRAAWIEEANA